MDSIRHRDAITLLLLSSLALSACGKNEQQPAPTTATTSTQAAPPPAAPARPSATVAPMPPTDSPVSATKLVSVELTSNVDASGRIGGAPASTFAPTDRIYALVKANNTGSNPSTISAHWEFEGGVVVNDSTQPVMSPGEAVTTFHIEKAGGWPEGHYKVTIAIDGQPVATRAFEIR